MTWLKGLAAAFIGGGANVITVIIVDPVAFNFGEQWQKTLTAAVVGGIIAAAAYLKQSPIPGGTGGDGSSGGTTAKLGSWMLASLLLLGTLSQTACGNATTLERVGATVVQVSKGITAEAASLRAAGLLTPAKLDALDKKAKAIEVSANALQSYLNSLPGVNAANRAEVVSKVGETLSLVSALVQNPDVLSLPPDNLFVKILTFGNITLQNVAVVLAAINPPAASFSSVGGGDSIPLSKIKVALAPVPKGAEKYFK